MKIFKQLAKEFWLPLVLSIGWVAYNVSASGEEVTWEINKLVNIFGPTFFLLSWLVGQFFRVRKQVRVEDGIGNVENRINHLLNELETRTNDTIAHVTGGDSFAYFSIGSVNPQNCEGMLTAVHMGEHPIYDVNARIVDLNKFEEVKANFSLASMQYTDTVVSVGNMIPSHAQMVSRWKLHGTDAQSYNVFITARNGGFTQLLRLKKVGGEWLTATKVVDSRDMQASAERVLFEQIHDSFPRNEEGLVEWS